MSYLHGAVLGRILATVRAEKKIEPSPYVESLQSFQKVSFESSIRPHLFLWASAIL